MSEIRKASIYTKKGDLGQTSLVDCQPVPKDHPRVEAYGELDEVNSSIGVLKQSVSRFPMLQDLEPILFKIQNHLFNIGSLLACEKREVLEKLPKLDQAHVEWLETQIDILNHPLPALREFILPGGHEASAWAHMCRTICRRSERKVARIVFEPASHEEYKTCLVYLNRLSDFFFTAARWIHLKTNTPEVKWNSKE